MACTPLGYRTMHDAVSNFSEPSKTSILLSMWQDPMARISIGSSLAKNRDISKSCTTISAKIPPPPFTYENGGGAGSREQGGGGGGGPAAGGAAAARARGGGGAK